MSIDRTALAEAVEAHFGLEIAARLDAAWATATPSPEESDADAGRAIAVALSTFPAADASPQVDALTLYAVELRATETFTFAPHDAFRHPLFSEWVTATFADALGECIFAGRIVGNIAQNAPTFENFRLVEEGSQVVQGQAALTFETKFGPVGVVLFFGKPTTNLCGRYLHCSGDAPYMVGVALRGGPLTTTNAPSEPESPPPAPGGGVLH